MKTPTSDREMIEKTRNTSRFFVESRQISWVLLVFTCLWGLYAYMSMPQRKDPETRVRTAVALTPWPGAPAERMEQLVTSKIEAQMASNSKVRKIESISRGSLSVVYVELDQQVRETDKEFDDIRLRLDSIRDLPDGAGPITFIKDFGDTAALMLTVASPRTDDIEIGLRAASIRMAIERERALAKGGQKATGGQRLTVVQCFPTALSARLLRERLAMMGTYLREVDWAGDVRPIEGSGFVGIDLQTNVDESTLLSRIQTFMASAFSESDQTPDVWKPVVVRDPAEAQVRLTQAAGEKYSYRELDQFTDLIARTLKSLPQVSKVNRAGILDEKVFLVYSQERLASYGLTPGVLPKVLGARNITLAGGRLDVEGKNISIQPSGEFTSEREIGDVTVAASPTGSPVYLRDVADIFRSYNAPPRYLNFYNWRDSGGNWNRTRAVTLSIQMRSGEMIEGFGQAVDRALGELGTRLPPDLILARTSDQPLQVKENISLFMRSLYEAILLVILVSLIGFWEWRSALLMALSIPITLALTFGMMHVLGIDLQQVSIATLIIALGLLVDDPVVAGDAIKRGLARGYPRAIAAWLGPTKLATAILFATVTNIVAYLPFLLLKGSTGEFLYSLPIVLTCALVASRIVSMTFIPFLGYYILRPAGEASVEDTRIVRTRKFATLYARVGKWAIRHRWQVAGASMAFLVLGAFFMSQLKMQFFPKDLSYLSFVDVWLPEDAPFSSTDRAAAKAEQVIEEVVDRVGREHGHESGESGPLLKSLTTFVGGGGPRFWFSVSPEMQQLNYAQIIIQVGDKHLTSQLIEPLQRELSARIPGTRMDVRQLESGKAIGLPIAVRISGTDIDYLRQMAEEVKTIFKSTPVAARVRDDWGDQAFTVALETNPDRANLSGISNLDVALASASGISGFPLTVLREGDKQIPVAARLRIEERAGLDALRNLYVYSSQGPQKVPLRQISDISYSMQTEKLRRRNQFRTVTVACMPGEGVLPSEVMAEVRPALARFQEQLPPGYRLEIGGEEEARKEGFRDLVLVLIISVVAIFLALVLQFKHAVKPLIVFAAIPSGMVGAVGALWIMGAPFGFMAFLGIISLIGVIVSHVIVLFDFIEEKHEQGEPLERALLDAGIMRLRPILITVGATVTALIPLALHGGPLWEPMCYAQIGGLALATVVTLLLVPVIYSIFVLDLKIVKWETE
ncbi:MAG: efflux RND transporter permease subunit [Acidobacteria bacterium]|nr:MAG: efflux RND transporter permease subunit [Acidobacteriota bacterium]